MTPNRETLEAAVVSVVIPCFNHASYLAEAIESVTGQDHPAVEVVVVDDGSTDETPLVAARYPVSYVRQVNSGLASARNLGLRQTSGEYLVFLDADDRLVPGALRIQCECLNRHGAWAFVSGEHRYISADGTVLKEWSGQAVARDHYTAMLRKNYIGCCNAVMFRRSALVAVGGFDTRLRACEDYDLYLRIARKFEVGAHCRLIADYRRYPDSMSGDPALMLASALQVLDSQRRHVRGDATLERARTDGIAFWQAYYGGRLAFRTRHQLRASGELANGIRGLLLLMRYSPRHVLHALFPAGRAVGERCAP